MFSGKLCPDCSALLPANTPAGLCPRCMLRLGASLEADLGEIDGTQPKTKSTRTLARQRIA